MWNDWSSVIPYRSSRSAAAASPPRCTVEANIRATSVAAVLFDVGGVLYDDTAWQRWLLQLLSHMGLHTHHASFFRLWERDFQEEVAWGRLDYWQAIRSFLLSAGLSRGQIDEVEAAGRARLREWEKNLLPFPQVRACVAQLTARGLRLGIACACPWSAEVLARVLDQLGLRERFSPVLSARELCGQVTREARFQALAGAVKLPAEQLAYVGRISQELHAASHAGLLTIAFNQQDDAVADIYLEQFSQLPQLFPSAPHATRIAG